jgi:hypothetical protein
MRLEGLGELKKFSDLIGIRSRNLPDCSIVPQPTTLPRGPRTKSSICISGLRECHCVMVSVVHLEWENDTNRKTALSALSALYPDWENVSSEDQSKTGVRMPWIAYYIPASSCSGWCFSFQGHSCEGEASCPALRPLVCYMSLLFYKCYDIFRPHKVIIMSILLRNCCTVWFLLVQCCKAWFKLVAVIV